MGWNASVRPVETAAHILGRVAAAKWRLVSDLIWWGRRGLEPATSGVTGRRSRVSREKKFYRL